MEGDHGGGIEDPSGRRALLVGIQERCPGALRRNIGIRRFEGV